MQVGQLSIDLLYGFRFGFSTWRSLAGGKRRLFRSVSSSLLLAQVLYEGADSSKLLFLYHSASDRRSSSCCSGPVQLLFVIEGVCRVDITFESTPAIFSSGVGSLGVCLVSIEEVGGRAIVQELVLMLRFNCVGVIVDTFKAVLIDLVSRLGGRGD